MITTLRRTILKDYLSLFEISKSFLIDGFEEKTLKFIEDHFQINGFKTIISISSIFEKHKSCLDVITFAS